MRALGFLLVCGLVLTGCGRPGGSVVGKEVRGGGAFEPVGLGSEWELAETQVLVLEGAKRQLENPAIYDASYRSLEYPMGDVAAGRGACTDVVIRALRAAGHDLQELIYRDAALGGYPRISRRDRNIDHRRCPNHLVFLKKFGEELPMETVGAGEDSWQPGDLVYWKLPAGLDHTGVVSDRVGPSGNLMVIHNLSRVMEEDVLAEWEIVGHFRYPKAR